MNWIPVEERLPEDNEDVLFYCNKYGIGTGWIDRGKWWSAILGGLVVTHWMPLPVSPGDNP
jgi:hypothetical protein